MKHVLTVGVLLTSALAHAYPIDQFERTQIRRLKWQQDVDAGTKRGIKDKPGATWPADKLELKLTTKGLDFRLTDATVKDPQLQQGLEQILKRNAFRSYNIAILDITDPTQPRYAGVDDRVRQLPGSVAKILIAAALFDELKRRFPTDIPARENFLRSIKMSADEWAMPNHHEVPVVWGDKLEFSAIRKVLRGDTFTLWEWVDHMMSPSSNAAASMVWREVTLMNLLGNEYPPAKYDDALFARFDKATFSAAAFNAIDKPLKDVGIEPEKFILRLFFTKGPSKFIDGDQSFVDPFTLVQWMVAMEQGRFVDAWSSLELKRLLYLTRRRIRYVKAPELDNAAILFKSGSFYECRPEEGYTCIQYQGNQTNVLNALVEVEAPPPEPKPEVKPATAPPPATPETPAVASGATSPPPAPKSPAPTLVYIVAVMSNELKKNAADDHTKLAGAVHKLLQTIHSQ